MFQRTSCRAQDSPNPRGILSSKASGEPSLMMSMGVLSALQQAAATARRDLRALQKRPESLAAGDIMGAHCWQRPRIRKPPC